MDCWHTWRAHLSWSLVRIWLLLLGGSVTGQSSAQCADCLDYCCDGTPEFCCSYYTYVGGVLSGTAISGVVFAVVFLMGAAAAVFLCLCVCVKRGRSSRVGILTASTVSTVTPGYPGPPPPYSYDCLLYPHNVLPPPYTPTPATSSYPPPPPYPGYSCK